MTLTPSDTVRLKQDKVVGKKTIAKKGDTVTIVAIHDEVLIVEGNERFSVRVEVIEQLKS